MYNILSAILIFIEYFLTPMKIYFNTIFAFNFDFSLTIKCHNVQRKESKL